MKNLKIITLFLILTISVSNLFSQNTCSALLKDGVYSQLKEITYYNEEFEARTAICDIYHEYKQTKDAAKASGSYAKIFKAKGSYSAEEIEKISKIYCGESFTSSELQKSSEIYRSFVDPNLMKAYQACIDANALGVKLKMSPTDYNTFNELTIVASSNTNPKPKVVELLYDESKLDIIGNLSDASAGEISLEKPKSFIAVRKDYKEADLRTEPKRMLASAHNLVLTFENGQAAAITFPEVWSNPTKKLEYGVGNVVASSLSEVKFKEIHGSNWMICDGSEAPDGSRYKEFVSENVPNLNNSGILSSIQYGAVKDGQDIKQHFNISSDLNWNYLLSLRNIQGGNLWNSDWEQDTNHFQVLMSGDIIVSRSKTLNRKHNKWGGWHPGEANFMALGFDKNVKYFIQID